MAEITALMNNLANNFSFQEALVLAKPLVLFILGIAIYSLFIFKFYRLVARREIFEYNLKRYEGAAFGGIRKFFHSIFYFLKYIILFPILTFFWFLVLSIVLTFLSKSDDMQGVLLIVYALVAVIRIMAYYNEDLSKDLAKMLPFALLGVFIVDATFFSTESSINALRTLPGLWKVIVYYLIFIVILEFLLRLIFLILSPLRKKRNEEDEKSD